MSNGTNDNLVNKKIEFLYSAIKDAQELIRFTDTKTAVVIPILGAFIITYFTQLSNIVKYYNFINIWFWIPFGLFILSLIFCILIVVRIINPTKDPSKNIKIQEEDKPSLVFFLANNDYKKKFLYRFKNSDEFKLDFDSNILLKQLLPNIDNTGNGIKEEDIIKTLSFEFLKVSYIRNVKMDRLKSLLRFLLITFIFFIISYIIYLNQLQIIEQIKKHCC